MDVVRGVEWCVAELFACNIYQSVVVDDRVERAVSRVFVRGALGCACALSRELRLTSRLGSGTQFASMPRMVRGVTNLSSSEKKSVRRGAAGWIQYSFPILM